MNLIEDAVRDLRNSIDISINDMEKDNWEEDDEEWKWSYTTEITQE